MTPYYSDSWLTVLQGDARTILATLPDESVHCVVTSPPYWGLRDYGTPGQLGLEATPELYVAALVEVFREVRRVLRQDGTLWLNLGDSYQNAKGRAGGFDPKQVARRHGLRPMDVTIPGLKPKDRVMIPARVALALQADGWWLRDEIIWHKPNPMPSSVEDRTTPAHEMVYLLSRSARYYYDAAAIREPTTGPDDERNRFGARIDVGYAGGSPDRRRNGARQKVPGGWDIAEGTHGTVHRDGRTVATYRDRNVGGRTDGFAQMPGGEAEWAEDGRLGRNKRSVWTIATEPYPEAHFATFPTKLVEPMILASCPVGGVVLDPFAGSGTVGLVAERLGRRAVLIELNPAYAAQILERVAAGRRDGTGAPLDLPLPAPSGSLWEVPA